MGMKAEAIMTEYAKSGDVELQNESGCKIESKIEYIRLCVVWH